MAVLKNRSLSSSFTKGAKDKPTDKTGEKEWLKYFAGELRYL